MSAKKDPQGGVPAQSKGSWSSFLKVYACMEQWWMPISC